MDNKLRIKLRSAYFKGQLLSEIDRISSQGSLSDEEWSEVDEYLTSLQTERENAIQRVVKYSLTDSVALPSTEELMNMSEDKRVAIIEREHEMEHIHACSCEIIEKARKANHITSLDQWLEWGFELASNQYHLDKYRVWKDQCYRARLVDIKDTYGCSRAEAEERAKLTQEYREYKNAVLFRELVDEIIKLCKKRYGDH